MSAGAEPGTTTGDGPGTVSGPEPGGGVGTEAAGWRNPIRALYDWVLGWADRPGAPWALGAISFAESSFFLIPPDVLLVPLCLAAPGRALWFATLCTAASVVGGVFGYLIGDFAYASLGEPLLEFYGAMDGFAQIQAWYQAYDAWAVGLAGFTPIPYKLFTITAGFFELDFGIFVVASAIGRGGRFFLVAVLLKLFGEPIQEFIDRYFNWLTLALAIVFVAGFLVLHYGLR